MDSEATSERFWPLVREALGGSRRDLTIMPLSRAVFLLAIPMVLEMMMESVFAVADIFWVSKLGANAVAAVGLTETIETVVYAISMGLAMGVGALVARRIGAKDAEGAARRPSSSASCWRWWSGRSAPPTPRICWASWAPPRRCGRWGPAMPGSCWVAASP